MVLTTRIVDTLDAMREIRLAYDEVAAACDALPFVTWEWLYRWWETAAQGYRMRLLTMWEGSELQGVLPLMQVSYGIRRGMMRELRFASDTVLASPTYMDLVARPGAEKACLDHAFGYLVEDPNWERMELCRLRAHSPVTALLCRIAAEHGFRAELRHYVACPFISLPATFEEYLEGLSRKRKAKVRESRNRLTREHSARFLRCTDVDAMHDLLEWHFDWKARRMGHLGKWTQFSDPAFRRFTHAIARDFHDKGLFRLWYLEAGGEPIATAYGIVANSTCYLKSHSFDDRYAKDSVSDVLFAYCVERAIEEGLSTVDFLSTPYPHKFHYANEIAQVLKLVLYRPRPRSLCSEALAHASALPASLLKRSRSRSAPTGEAAKEVGSEEQDPVQTEAQEVTGRLTLATMETLAGIEKIEAEWDDLFEACDRATPGTSWEWNYHWWRHFGQRHEMRAIAFWAEGGRLAGIAPLMRLPARWHRPRELRCVSDYRAGNLSYADLLFRPGFERLCLRGLFEHLSRDDGWDRMRLSRLRADSPGVWEFCSEAAVADFRVEMDVQAWGVYARLPDSYEEYVSQLSKHRRKKLRGIFNRIEGKHRCCLRTVQTEAEVVEAVSWLVRHKQERMHGMGRWTWLDDPRHEPFLRDYCTAALRKGRLRFYLLELDGHVAACALVLVAGHTADVCLDAYDRQYEAASVSDAMQVLCARACIEEGFEIMDLGRSVQPHKLHYAKERRAVVELDLYRPRPRSLVFEAASHLAPPVWHIARRVLPGRLKAAISRSVKREAVAPDSARDGGDERDA